MHLIFGVLPTVMLVASRIAVFFNIEQKYVAMDQRNFGCLENEGITSFLFFVVFSSSSQLHFCHDLRQSFGFSLALTGSQLVLISPLFIQLTVMLKWGNVSL